jgi:glutamine amidotransferase
VKKSDKIVLPGQGSFKACKNGIDNIKGLQEELNESVLIKKKPIYGICAGMQLFATIGHEEKKTTGLNWIAGEVIKLDSGSLKLKIPHMGWNELKVENVSSVFQDVINEDHAYFIHSYEFVPENKKVISITTNYGKDVIAAVSLGNIFGSQFHPEKSQKTGIKILTNFLNL